MTKRAVFLASVATILSAGWLVAQQPAAPMSIHDEFKEGSAASQGMLDAIDNSPAGSVYVMVVEDGKDYAGISGLMATAMKYRGLPAR